MNPWFADTFFFLALLNSNDRAHHIKARELNRVDRPVVTSSWVMLELADHLCDIRNRHLFPQVLHEVQADSRYELLSADHALLEEAIQLYAQRADKEWSLTDCTSFLIMRKRGVTEALTGDRHFEQAGFEVVFK